MLERREYLTAEEQLTVGIVNYITECNRLKIHLDFIESERSRLKRENEKLQKIVKAYKCFVSEEADMEEEMNEYLDNLDLDDERELPF